MRGLGGWGPWGAVLCLGMAASPGPAAAGGPGGSGLGASALTAGEVAVWNFDEDDGGFDTDEHPWRRWYRRTFQDSDPLGPGLSNEPRDDGVWSTNLPSKAYAYPEGVRIHLWSPEVTVPPDGVMVFELWHTFDTQAGGAGGRVSFEVDGAQIPLVPFGGYPGSLAVDGVPVGAFTGHDGRWVKSFFDLAPVQAELPGASVVGRLRLEFQSNDVSEGMGWNVERVTLWQGDAIPPVISPVVSPADTDRYDRAYEVVVEIMENDALAEASVLWSRQGEGDEHTVRMVAIGGGDWRATIPAQAPGTTVSWWVVAEDEEGNVGVYPPDGEALPSFTVDVPGPSGLSPVDTPRITHEVNLGWQPPDAGPQVDAYRVYRAPTAALLSLPDEALRVAEVAAGARSPTATLDLEDGSGKYFAVTAVYPEAGGEGPWESVPSIPLAVDSTLPALEGLSPEAGYQGQAVEVEIRGLVSDFSQGRVAILPGEGVTVDSVDVVNVRALRARLEIDAGAAVGERALAVEVDGLPRGALPFTILSSSERPSIAGLTPRTARQGLSMEVKFLGRNTDFRNEPPFVDFGAGILVTGEPVAASDGLSFTVPILVEARCDVGVRSVLVSSGDVVFADIPFEVQAGAIGISDGCDTSGGAGAPMALGLGMLFALGLWRRLRG